MCCYVLNQIFDFLINFFISLFSTSIGCFLAIFLTKKYDSKKEDKEKKLLCSNIKIELEKIKRQIIDIKTTTDRIYINPIKTPFYDSLINTNKSNLLMSYSWFYCTNKNLQSESLQDVIEIYEYINEFNKWHTWMTNNYPNEEIICLSTNHTQKLAKLIIEGIEEILELINKEIENV